MRRDYWMNQVIERNNRYTISGEEYIYEYNGTRFNNNNNNSSNNYNNNNMCVSKNDKYGNRINDHPTTIIYYY